jgi:hypothetical protein
MFWSFCKNRNRSWKKGILYGGKTVLNLKILSDSLYKNYTEFHEEGTALHREDGK